MMLPIHFANCTDFFSEVVIECKNRAAGIFYHPYYSDYGWIWVDSKYKSDFRQHILVHEIGHALGIGSLWGFIPNVIEYNIENNLYLYKYENSKAINEYKRYFGDHLEFIPLENNGIPGQIHVHPEEGEEIGVSSNNIYINGVLYPGLDKELMTGWLDDEDSHTFIPSLSRITLGFLEDIGFDVNYDNADEYIASQQNI